MVYCKTSPLAHQAEFVGYINITEFSFSIHTPDSRSNFINDNLILISHTQNSKKMNKVKLKTKINEK